jgi:hypothetical protein
VGDAARRCALLTPMRLLSSRTFSLASRCSKHHMQEGCEAAPDSTAGSAVFTRLPRTGMGKPSWGWQLLYHTGCWMLLS